MIYSKEMIRLLQKVRKVTPDTIYVGCLGYVSFDKNVNVEAAADSIIDMIKMELGHGEYKIDDDNKVWKRIRTI